MIAKLRALSPVQILLLVIAWPALLVIATVVGVLWLTRDGSHAIGVHVSSWALLLLIVFGPSVLLGALWIVVRWRRGPA